MSLRANTMPWECPGKHSGAFRLPLACGALTANHWLAVVDGQEGDVEGAAAQVEDQNVQMPAADVDDGGVMGGDQRASGRRKSWRCVGRQQGRAVSRESPSAYYRRPQRLQSTPRKWRVPRLVGE